MRIKPIKVIKRPTKVIKLTAERKSKAIAKKQQTLQPPKMQTFDGLFSLMNIATDPVKSLSFFESMIWQSGVFCPYCGLFDVTRSNSNPNEYKCFNCCNNTRFNAKKGTIFEDTRIPFGKWLLAIYFENSTTGGISAPDLATHIEIDENTAGYMLDIIRTIGYDQSIWDITKKMKGNRKTKVNTHEIDNSYLGGKFRNLTRSQRRKRKEWAKEKIKLFGILHRGGYVKAFVVEELTAEIMMPLIIEHIPEGSKIYSDGANIFDELNDLNYDHQTVIHSEGKYVRGKVYTNTIENFWSFLKTGLVTSFRNRVTKENAFKFVNAAVFRYNSRNMTEFEKMLLVLENIILYARQQQRQLMAS